MITNGALKTKLFLLAAFAFFLLAPRGARAEMVGALMPTKEIAYFKAVHQALEGELKAAGAELQLQQPAPTAMAWTNAVRKLVTLNAKVIVAYGAGTALAAVTEAPGVPVVYCGVYDPAAAGLTGKNATGVNANVPLQGLIANLKKVVPFTKLAILYSSDDTGSVKEMEDVAALGAKLSFEAVKVDGKDTPDKIALPAGAEAAFLTSAAIVNTQKGLEGIIAQARTGKVATAAILGGTAELGVLISLSASAEQQGKDAAKMVADILKGTAASAIPANTTPKVELTISVKEAKALGFNIPFDLLGTAKVIN